MSYNYAQSLALVHTDRVITVPKNCYGNSLSALRVCKKQLSDAWYVEGHIEFIAGLYIKHGWLELPYGTILDTTRAYLETYHGHTPDKQTYYPLLRYTRTDLKGVRPQQLPLGMLELNIWEFEKLPAAIQQNVLRGQSLEAYITNIRERYGRKQVGHHAQDYS